MQYLAIIFLFPIIIALIGFLWKKDKALGYPEGSIRAFIILIPLTALVTVLFIGSPKLREMALGALAAVIPQALQYYYQTRKEEKELEKKNV
ncbi:MAG TPA: hypothetical protein ENG63_06990 [Candidatus Desulfofervidus auxilii]|uniref:Uncharacterized protein n=1 Tax=Desulfofervidus auxilii TaxID=1621989 RepID=A0A7C0Y395_DESA2|nr:hypothetical protein [Candidatus Desulfofervidus auxilii]